MGVSAMTCACTLSGIMVIATRRHPLPLLAFSHLRNKFFLPLITAEGRTVPVGNSALS